MVSKSYEGRIKWPGDGAHPAIYEKLLNDMIKANPHARWVMAVYLCNFSRQSAHSILKAYWHQESPSAGGSGEQKLLGDSPVRGVSPTHLANFGLTRCVITD